MSEPKFFFTADLHFHHNKILQFCPNSRPNCTTLEEMHTRLIDNWNSQVSPLDHVYVLGDFSFGNPEQAASILAQLNGQIHLIKGNHDHWLNSYTKTFLTSVSDYKIFKRGNHRAVLFHYPIAEWDRMHYGSIHLYGHVHGALKLPGRAIDVGIDARPLSDMRLWEWDEIVQRALSLPVQNRQHKTSPKPIIKEGDYLITYHDAFDNEISQDTAQSLFKSREKAKKVLHISPTTHSYRIMRCLDNTKYNKWSP